METFPEFTKVTRYECILGPGDVLFIPGKLCLLSGEKNGVFLYVIIFKQTSFWSALKQQSG